jgi:multidrug efflux system membrane fusion protein
VTNDNQDFLASGTSTPSARRNRFRAVSIVVVVALVLVGLVLMIRRTPHGAPANPARAGEKPGGPGDPIPVTVATAAIGDIEVRIPALGTVTPLATVTVRTQISGILRKIAFTEGQLVHQGEVIAEIDPRPYEAAVEQMEGNLKRDQALLADAKLDLKRYEGLVKEDSIAVQQLDTQRALVDQYEGTIQSDQGQLKTAQVNLIYTRIVSPVNGRVGLRQVDQGNYVTPGDANGIVVINQLQPISVIFPIPEDNVPALTQQLRNGGALEVDAFDRTNSKKLAQGKLLTLDNQIDITTGTVKLRALFDNADGALFPNQFVNVQLLQEVLKRQVIMPNSAVRRGAPNGIVTTFVYAVKPDNTVEVRPIKLGVVDGDRAAVIAGLAAGEVVVTEGGDRLRDGAQVTRSPADSR